MVPLCNDQAVLFWPTQNSRVSSVHHGQEEGPQNTVVDTGAVLTQCRARQRVCGIMEELLGQGRLFWQREVTPAQRDSVWASATDRWLCCEFTLLLQAPGVGYFM